MIFTAEAVIQGSCAARLFVTKSAHVCKLIHSASCAALHLAGQPLATDRKQVSQAALVRVVRLPVPLARAGPCASTALAPALPLLRRVETALVGAGAAWAESAEAGAGVLPGPSIKAFSCSVQRPHKLLVAAVALGDLAQALLPERRHSVRCRGGSRAAPGPGSARSRWPLMLLP